jgi:pyridoxine 5-phosphate synthase
MTLLSVNLNKIALIRNSRDSHTPDPLSFALKAIEFGAQGITVHPRPDSRHIRPDDVHALAKGIDVEFNIEGNPTPAFCNLVNTVKPAQVTLVPDDPAQLTSDHGWDLNAKVSLLEPIIAEFKANGIRVSLFMDPVPALMPIAAHIGADRIELYTEAYAQAWGTAKQEIVLQSYIDTAIEATANGLGINAGHDLNQENLVEFAHRIPNLLEVSIGHALVSEALIDGWESTIKSYISILEND